MRCHGRVAKIHHYCNEILLHVQACAREALPRIARLLWIAASSEMNGAELSSESWEKSPAG
jgi:hypothetical protein